MTEEVIEDSGLVTAINGKIATVQIERGAGCKSCSMHGFCMKNVPTEFDLATEIVLKPGDRVLLDLSPSGRILVSLLIFGLPLVFLFGGFIVASQWISEILSILVGFSALAFSFLLIRIIDSKFGKKMDIRIARKL
ncbi:hypothetical protein MASR2M64_16320 [Candidatus Cloacimonadota bacterium]